MKLTALLTLLVCTPVFADPSDAPVADAGTIVPLEEGEPAPFSGLLFPEKAAEKVFNDRVDLKKVKADYDADKKAWAEKEDAYKKQADGMKPGWWSEYKGQIGLVAGFILGAATVMIVVYGVSQAQK